MSLLKDLIQGHPSQRFSRNAYRTTFTCAVIGAAIMLYRLTVSDRQLVQSTPIFATPRDGQLYLVMDAVLLIIFLLSAGMIAYHLHRLKHKK